MKIRKPREGFLRNLRSKEAFALAGSHCYTFCLALLDTAENRPFVRPEDLGRWSSGRIDSQDDILGTLGHTLTRTRHGTHRKPNSSQNTHKNDTQTTRGHARRRERRIVRYKSIPEFDGSGVKLILSSAVSASLAHATLTTHSAQTPQNSTVHDPWELTVCIPSGYSGTAGALRSPRTF